MTADIMIVLSDRSLSKKLTAKITCDFLNKAANFKQFFKLSEKSLDYVKNTLDDNLIVFIDYDTPLETLYETNPEAHVFRVLSKEHLEHVESFSPGTGEKENLLFSEAIPQTNFFKLIEGTCGVPASTYEEELHGVND